MRKHACPFPIAQCTVHSAACHTTVHNASVQLAMWAATPGDAGAYVQRANIDMDIPRAPPQGSGRVRMRRALSAQANATLYVPAAPPPEPGSEPPPAAALTPRRAAPWAHPGHDIAQDILGRLAVWRDDWTSAWQYGLRCAHGLCKHLAAAYA